MSVELGPGEVFGGYEILEVAGVGGMGVVYRARQSSLERTVALKLIRPEIAETSDFRQRFLREARLAAAVDHPHIVSVYDVGERDGQLFLAMQWVNGQDLASMIARGGALPVDRAVAICSQLAGALDAVHAAGLVHRDVKPANVLVRSMGGRDHAYLTDFGVARAREAIAGLTKAGYLVGTAGFMSPEQIRGEQPDSGSDLYALGCVAYECLTGRPPFTADNAIALYWAHANDPRPCPGAVNPALGDRFDAFMAKAMAIDPAVRFDDGQDFSRAMAEAAQSRPLAVAPAGAPTVVSPRAPGLGAPAAAPATSTSATGSASAVEPDTRVQTAPAAERSAPPTAASRRGRGLLGGAGRAVALIAIGVAGIAAGALAASGVFSSGGPAKTTATDGTGASAQVAAVIDVLKRYETAFSHRDPSGLGSLMTPNVTRLGLRPPQRACQVQSGLQSVIRAEQANFGGTYHFTNLSPSVVQVSGSTASVSTAYSISTGGSGPIRLVLVNGPSGWLISRINANC